ncbi:hypothetical protein FOZ63_030302 [Perkinsus olseni]|uniref:Uncharacterized protein n=2 Tax=Perkinsus olseni TaxID=32597 RepID=A0A7J6UJD9_PEROL|nr:hypothetical protein FOZ63_030302 [Perkinsus olseni]
MGLFSGFPLLEKADSSWCYFTNSNMREDRKSLWILVKPDYALQTLYIICPRTSQWDTFQADFSADATLARYYPSGYDKWPEWRREDERYNSYGEDDPIMDPLGVNFTLKLSAGKTKKPEKVCSAVLRALQKKYGSYKDMCGGYREAIAGRSRLCQQHQIAYSAFWKNGSLATPSTNSEDLSAIFPTKCTFYPKAKIFIASQSLQYHIDPELLRLNIG